MKERMGGRGHGRGRGSASLCGDGRAPSESLTANAAGVWRRSREFELQAPATRRGYGGGPASLSCKHTPAMWRGYGGGSTQRGRESDDEAEPLVTVGDDCRHCGVLETQTASLSIASRVPYLQHASHWSRVGVAYGNRGSLVVRLCQSCGWVRVGIRAREEGCWTRGEGRRAAARKRREAVRKKSR